MAGGAFRVMLEMTIKPGLSAEFEQEWRSGTDAVTGHPANIGQWLARSTADEDTYYIVSDWVDETGFRAFEDGKAHVAHRERLHAYRASATFDTMRVVEHIEGAAHAR
ncbi:antibiotic biosynthesis monooxygenase family protein [Streptomyces sp. H10-C2]|uniref:antibiotic biosynthesis monooxygenase family protein n=1 Tax=unclassified Streptomyces TaxID=2593676 RepID=UPI0024B895E7|nr:MULTISPECIES: antibiotic biosynthesis monooxygenase family protein [unclassified Streptomyces]MDJ0346954.1 antibiotic biosynthesis monooxygenase family protein [Streptomyces sp. PH10-H1]MDJ0370477.1 antibiotic biosynthesis monooxygenase family protein [Streptomyces sp. H10-C2]